MKELKQQCGQSPSRNRAGMTLVEVVMSMAISGMAVGVIVSGYTYCTTSAEKAALTLAASARAMERVEETRSAKWDTAAWPMVDELVATNFPSKIVTLDLSGSGKDVKYAKVTTQISSISAKPPLKGIRVDCVWTFRGSQLVTNTIETCRAPDQ